MAQDTAWFEGAVQPDRVRSLLARDVPEFSSGQLNLLDCEVSRVRSAPADGYWTATYSLTVAEPSVAKGRTVVAYGTLIPPGEPAPSWPTNGTPPVGADGWRCYLPELRLELRAAEVAAGLPALTLLTDPARARALLETVLRDNGYDGIRLAGVTPEITGLKVGVRCTVLCHLEHAAGTGPHLPATVVAKLHHDETGERVDRVLRALWSSPLGRSEHLAIAQPLAYLPESRLLLQGWVPGDRTLKDLLHAGLLDASTATRGELAVAMRRAGRGLAEVHRCGVREGRLVTWSEELGILRKKHHKLAAVVPQLRALGSVLERLETAAAATPSDPPVPAHHSFRPSEVLLSDGRVGFIDFDNFCQAEPASDLATFTTKVRHAGMNKLVPNRETSDEDEVLDDETRLARLARTGSICEDFLAGYTSHAPVSRDRLALWEALELFSLTLSAAKKALPARIDNCAFMLRHHLQEHGL